MRRQLIKLLTTVLLVPSLLPALPAVGGGRGLFRVQNALTEETGIRLSGYGVGRHPLFPGTQVSGWVADGIGALQITPVSSRFIGAELFGSWGGIVQWPATPEDSANRPRGFNDARAGLKLSFPYLKVIKLGGMAAYTLRPRDRFDPSIANYHPAWLDPDCIAPGWRVNGADTSFSPLAWSGLLNFQFQDLAPAAPNLLFNIGRSAQRWQYGAGLEWVSSSFDVFGEARSLCPEGSMNPMDTLADARLTAGGRFKFGYAFALSLAYTFGLAKSSPNEAVLGFEWTTPFLLKSAVRFGAVAGRTVDARTGAALVTKLSFPEYAKMPPVFSDSATGVFKIKKVPVGDVIIEARVNGYVTQAMPLAVTENQTMAYDFHMRPTSTYGTVAGVVTDAATGLPLPATIEFPGRQIKPVVADSAGTFCVSDMETGIYTVTATLDNYVAGTLVVTVEDDKSTIASFSLSPAALVVTMTGKVSDKKTGDALAATLTCTGTSLPVVKTDPVSGMYKVDLPSGACAIVVAAPGYIKQTAQVTLEKDKPLARDFELVKEGMAITLRGIYFDFNKATIKPESKPALDDAARTLKDNPTIIVEIQGYTDGQGSDEYNLKLSNQRASSVVNYLVHNYGVSIARLTARGYGEAKPIATNDTDSDRALNRRVEFVILGQTEPK